MYHLKICEKYQTVETDIDLEDVSNLHFIIQAIREEIIEATKDIEDKKEVKRVADDDGVVADDPPSPAQIHYLKGLGATNEQIKACPTRLDASELITKLKKKI